MSSTNKTTYYELPQYTENDIFNPLTDDNDAYAKIDTALHNIANAEADNAADIVSIKNRLDGAEGDIDALEAQNGSEVLTTVAQTLSGAVNELKSGEDSLDGRLDVVEDDINNVSTGLKVKVSALETQNGSTELTTVAQTLSGAVNELKSGEDSLDGRLDIAEAAIRALNSEFSNLIVVEEDTSFANVSAAISAISGKVVLVLKANITGLVNNDAFPNNLALVIGLGGIFTGNGGAGKSIYFPKNCKFICGNYPLFNEWCIAKCTDGYLDGEALVSWWGAVADGTTDVSTIFTLLDLTSFKTLRFLKGVYRGYFTNHLDGRTLIFDEGCIIDGIVHIAYGSNLAAATKKWCKNTNVIGKVVSTVRVGGAQIDGLNMPDGIEILATNSDYLNQTAEGGPKGVHWHFGCKNINVGDIVVNEVVSVSAGVAYALGIDYENDEEIPHDIYVKSIKSGANSSSNYDINISKAYNITFGDIQTASGANVINTLRVVDGAHDIKVGKLSTKYHNDNAQAAVIIGGASNVYFDSIDILPDTDTALACWGLFFNQSADAFVGKLHTKYMTQGLRGVSSNDIVIVSHISENDTTPVVTATSTIEVLKSFT